MKSSMGIVATAALLVASVAAQQQYTIDPSSVPDSTKVGWCDSQKNQCPLICLQTSPSNSTPTTNSCDATDLTFACVCGNGLSPNVSEYTLTLPYFICEEWGTQCVSNCGSDNNCANNCRSQHPCGAQHPKAGKTSTSMSATAAATTTGSSGDTLYTGFAGTTPSNTGESSAAHIRVAALNAGKTFGTLGVVGLLFGGFAVIL